MRSSYIVVPRSLAEDRTDTSVYISVPPKTHGGTERIVYYLCQQISRRGHQVELFASGDSKVDCTLQSVLPIACQDDPLSTFYLEKEFETRHTYDLYRQAERFDVVHAHSPTLAPYFSAFTTTPTLVTYGYIEKELHEYYRAHFPLCLPVCVSQAQRKMLGDESIPVVYNGIDMNEILFNDKPEDFFIRGRRQLKGMRGIRMPEGGGGAHCCQSPLNCREQEYFQGGSRII